MAKTIWAAEESLVVKHMQKETRTWNTINVGHTAVRTEQLPTLQAEYSGV